MSHSAYFDSQCNRENRYNSRNNRVEEDPRISLHDPVSQNQMRCHESKGQHTHEAGVDGRQICALTAQLHRGAALESGKNKKYPGAESQRQPNKVILGDSDFQLEVEDRTEGYGDSSPKKGTCHDRGCDLVPRRLEVQWIRVLLGAVGSEAPRNHQGPDPSEEIIKRAGEHQQNVAM